MRNRIPRFSITLILLLGLLLGARAPGFQSVAHAAAISSSDTHEKSGNSGEAKPALPGTQLAQTISLVTGIAISPLLGVSAVGAWKYFQAKDGTRSSLPWFSNPLFWMPALCLVGLCFLKDVMGPAVPTALKKPFDLAEVFENKISALVATGAFLPLVTGIFKMLTSGGSSSAVIDTSDFGLIQFASFWGYLTVPFAFAAFCIVWLVSHAIQILILISPFATLDAALKAFRAFLLSTVTITSFASPLVGAVWSLIIVVICYFMAGWAFRTTFFGTLVAWEILTRRKHRFSPSEGENAMFLAREVDGVPIRTYGRLSRDGDGRWVFRYRPYLFLTEKMLPIHSTQLAAGVGILNSEIVEVQGDEITSLFFLPPRYRDHEEALSRIYGFGPLETIGLARGFKAIWSWFCELFGYQSRAA